MLSRGDIEDIYFYEGELARVEDALSAYAELTPKQLRCSCIGDRVATLRVEKGRIEGVLAALEGRGAPAVLGHELLGGEAA